MSVHAVRGYADMSNMHDDRGKTTTDAEESTWISLGDAVSAVLVKLAKAVRT